MTLTRRALFKGMGASLLLAPSIVRASSLDYVPRERLQTYMWEKWSQVNGFWLRGFHADATGWAYASDRGYYPVFDPQNLTCGLPHA